MQQLKFPGVRQIIKAWFCVLIENKNISALINSVMKLETLQGLTYFMHALRNYYTVDLVHRMLHVEVEKCTMYPLDH